MEGRATGIPKIYDALERNGSPRPHIETDEGRTYFLIELPIHPDFKIRGKASAKAPEEAHQKAYEGTHDEAHERAQDTHLNETERRILALGVDGPFAPAQLRRTLGGKTLSGNAKKAINRLLEVGALAYTIPDTRPATIALRNAGRSRKMAAPVPPCLATRPQLATSVSTTESIATEYSGATVVAVARKMAG